MAFHWVKSLHKLWDEFWHLFKRFYSIALSWNLPVHLVYLFFQQKQLWGRSVNYQLDNAEPFGELMSKFGLLKKIESCEIIVIFMVFDGTGWQQNFAPLAVLNGAWVAQVVRPGSHQKRDAASQNKSTASATQLLLWNVLCFVHVSRLSLFYTGCEHLQWFHKFTGAAFSVCVCVCVCVCVVMDSHETKLQGASILAHFPERCASRWTLHPVTRTWTHPVWTRPPVIWTGRIWSVTPLTPLIWCLSAELISRTIRVRLLPQTVEKTSGGGGKKTKGLRRFCWLGASQDFCPVSLTRIILLLWRVGRGCHEHSKSQLLQKVNCTQRQTSWLQNRLKRDEWASYFPPTPTLPTKMSSLKSACSTCPVDTKQPQK